MTRYAVGTLMLAGWTAAAVVAQQPAPPAPQPAQSETNLGSDANGNPLRRATKTGHVSNYDEAKVGTFTLPDPLVMADGTPVRDAEAWRSRRRPELIGIYQREIYGRVPANAPKVTWAVASTAAARDGAATLKEVVGTAGEGPAARRIRLSVYTPAAATGRVPMILLINFGGGTQPPPPAAANRPVPTGEPPVADAILARGWGYATVRYQDIQADRADSWTDGVIGLTFGPGQTAPAPGEWGTISAWAWGISRILDYFGTDSAVDAARVALHGHSRLGKTVLWASATEPRIVATFSSCSGEMGAALARRDWGETVDDMAQNFPWQFAAGVQKYAGRWNDMPVDAHTLIALSAPRPVFITGGTTDQWADPVGMFQAEVAASPVYRLLGGKGLGVTELPPLDTPVVDGDLGWHYHTGGHTATKADWEAFLTFVEKAFK